MRLTNYLHYIDENLKLDFNDRLSILWQDGQFQKESIMQKTEKSEELIRSIREKLSQYKFSYYIEYVNVSSAEFTVLDLPDYVIKQNDIKFDIKYVKVNDYFGYYQLMITDGKGNNVPSQSNFFTSQNSRDTKYAHEFEHVEKQLREHIEDIQTSYNERINKFKDEKEA